MLCMRFSNFYFIHFSPLLCIRYEYKYTHTNNEKKIINHDLECFLVKLSLFVEFQADDKKNDVDTKTTEDEKVEEDPKKEEDGK